MRLVVWTLLLFGMLVSCQEVERTPKPDDLIAEDKMVEILTEISLLHGARSYNKNLMEEKGIDPYPYLMRKFEIDSSQLVRSNNYYSENARQYQRIYEKVKERLESLVQKYDSLIAIEERKRDSIMEIEQKKKLDSLRKLYPNDSLQLRSMEIDSLVPDTTVRNLPAPVTRNRGVSNARS